MTWFLLGLPHTQLTDEYVSCAYTQKCRKFLRMMGGTNDITYLGPGPVDPTAAYFHVPTVTPAEQHAWFGEWDPHTSPDVDWDASKPWWQVSNARAYAEIAKAWQPGDLVLMTGSSQWAAVETLPQCEGAVVEWAVGYPGCRVRGTHRIFESYAWMHMIYGAHREMDGRWFDAVVPNFFDPDEFPVGDGDGGYLAWMGRYDARKGQRVAISVAERVGLPLRLAGPGYDGSALPDHVEHVGPLGPADRAKFMGEAVALLAPTEYIEPFGGVTVEAMLCGTPAVTTDWGGFTETITEEWRFRTLAEAATIVGSIAGSDEARDIARFIAEDFTLANVRPRMQAALDRVATLWQPEGWAL